jgi:hypothetical protein
MATPPQPPQGASPVFGIRHNASFPKDGQVIQNLMADNETDDDSEDEIAETVSEERKGLFEKGNTMDYTDFRGKYPKRFKYSLVDPKNQGFPTLLHLIVSKLEGITPGTEGPLKTLAKLALVEQIDLLGVQNDKGETVLHVAVSQEHGDFVRYICECLAKLSSGSESLRSAIAKCNNGTKTCLHIAASAENPDLKMVNTLIKGADKPTLDKKRRDTGNTALHDLVKCSRCRVQVKRCQVPDCSECKLTELTDEESFMETLRNLVQGSPQALVTLNNDGKSPYLYHMSTIGESKEVAEAGKTAIVGSGSAAQESSNKVNPKKGQNAELGQNPKNNTSSKQSSNSQARPKRGRKKHISPDWAVSLALQTKVADYLMESSLSLEKFEDACKALLGRSKCYLSCDNGKGCIGANCLT